MKYSEKVVRYFTQGKLRWIFKVWKKLITTGIYQKKCADYILITNEQILMNKIFIIWVKSKEISERKSTLINYNKLRIYDSLVKNSFTFWKKITKLNKRSKYFTVTTIAYKKAQIFKHWLTTVGNRHRLSSLIRIKDYHMRRRVTKTLTYWNWHVHRKTRIRLTTKTFIQDRNRRALSKCVHSLKSLMTLKKNIVTFKIRWLAKHKLSIKRSFFKTLQALKLTLLTFQTLSQKFLTPYKFRVLLNSTLHLVENNCNQELIAKKIFFQKRLGFRRLLQKSFQKISQRKKVQFIEMMSTRRLLIKWHHAYCARCYEKYLSELGEFWARKLFFKRSKRFVKAKRVDNQILMLYVFTLIKKGFYGFKWNYLMNRSLLSKRKVIRGKSDRDGVRRFWVMWRRVFVIRKSLKGMKMVGRKVGGR